MKPTIIVQGLNVSFQLLFDQLTCYLITGWGLLILFGTFNAVLLIALGVIKWFTGVDSKKGRNMIIGGIILFIAIQWLAFNPPWQFVFGLLSAGFFILYI